MTRTLILSFFLGVFVTSEAFAEGRIMRCVVNEKFGTQRMSYTFDIPSRSNYTVHYYNYARLVPNFYVRASGMAGGGATFLHLDIEDLMTKQTGFTKVKSSGNIYLGTKERSIEMGCEIL